MRLVVGHLDYNIFLISLFADSASISRGLSAVVAFGLSSTGTGTCFKVYYTLINASLYLYPAIIIQLPSSSSSSSARSKTVSVHWRQGTAETRFHNTVTSIRRPAAAAVPANQHPAQRDSLPMHGNTIPSTDCHVQATPPTMTTTQQQR